jgi:hypothetical protein
MDKELFTILKELKNINPDSDYSKKSRFLLLSQQKPQINSVVPGPARFMNLLRFSAVSGILIALAISGGVYYNGKSNKDELIVRAGELNGSIQVKLNEIKYLLESNNRRLNNEEITVIQVMLDKTANELKEAGDLNQNNEDLEKSLEKIKAAKDALLQIGAMLKHQ